MSLRASDVVQKTKTKFPRQKAGTPFRSFAALWSDWNNAAARSAPSAESDREEENRTKENRRKEDTDE